MHGMMFSIDVSPFLAGRFPGCPVKALHA